ncbi:L-seryl-tRNA(Sec) selenium transferase [Paracoccus thiocyanatus]|uniref:L-seryl-tRNA(Sec) selenium transferase n=1 Tax=Paracoccus thiocyanatus TaxID=34006 RepID=A0A1N6QGF1_9RHOB|nr:L-seryl-tRNA(Sec) selenium transferase [Paracoccus thiocyanatus]SIQ15640.1 L-seryl-tRNA(Sec) selenium transferase [Paracoccus thiocyanatus]
MDPRSALPSVDRLLRRPEATHLIAHHGRDTVLGMLRGLLQARRMAAGRGEPADAEGVLEECAARLAAQARPSLRAVLNLTGTVNHTNLGRALLSRPAAEAAFQAMVSATNLEYDLDRGARGDRDCHVEALICRLTGAEAATVVNNNAAAVLLMLNTLALGQEVVVSRGELVEIGGAFRVPEVMARAGCRLHEVGATNRTHLRDFANAVNAETAAFMKVHASNYAIEGFTAEVPQADLAALARRHGLPLLIDLGSGSLLDLGAFGLPPEPTARQAIRDGADAVTFSGDKLLGGPQCGIIAGSRALVDRMRANPLKRALRVDKIILAALGATLQAHADPERARTEIPTLRLLTRPQGEIRALADRLCPPVRAALSGRAKVAVIDCLSQIGSGARPVDLLPSAGLAFSETGAVPVARIAQAFRALPLPVVGRVHKGRFLLDLRCLEDETAFLAQLGQLDFGRAGG